MRKFILILCLSVPFLKSSASYKDEILKLARIDLLPTFQKDAIVKQVSSYDTTGGNDDGFSGKYSYLRKESGKLVIAEFEGAGIIKRIWTPTPSEDTIQFYFDGEAEPRIELPFIDLFSGHHYPFQRPVVGNEVGGYYCYLPIPYQKSCKIIFKGDRMKFFQIQYCEIRENTVNSFPIEFGPEEKDALSSVINIWQNTGKKIIDLLSIRAEIKSESHFVNLKPGEISPVFDMAERGRIVGIEFVPQVCLNNRFKDLILRARWDNEQVLAINSPFTDFFGYSFGEPSMRSLLSGVREDGTHYCYLPMPFEKNALLELQFIKNEKNETASIPVKVTVFYTDEKRRTDEGKLYTLWHREKNPDVGQSYKFLNTKGRGHYVGTLLQAQGLTPGMTRFFEGDDRCYVDGELRLHGTGSEDYFNGGWYAVIDRWDMAYSLPLHGCLGYSIPLARTGGFRFFITDKISFEEYISKTIEHGPVNNLPVDYTSVAFYYCDTPPASNDLPEVDMLKEIETPKTLEYLPNLLPMKVGYGNVMLNTEKVKDEDGKTRNIVKFETTLPALVNYELAVPLQGQYKMFLSYMKGQECGLFSVYQRQIPIKTDMDGLAKKNVFIEKEFIGIVNFLKGTNTVSFILDNNHKNTGNKSVMLNRIYLEKTN